MMSCDAGLLMRSLDCARDDVFEYYGRAFQADKGVAKDQGAGRVIANRRYAERSRGISLKHTSKAPNGDNTKRVEIISRNLQQGLPGASRETTIVILNVTTPIVISSAAERSKVQS